MLLFESFTNSLASVPHAVCPNSTSESHINEPLVASVFTIQKLFSQLFKRVSIIPQEYTAFVSELKTTLRQRPLPNSYGSGVILIVCIQSISHSVCA